jgi:hypothetical protein
MWLVIVILAFVWITRRNTAPDAVSTSAGQQGGWHSPLQTLQLGGSNLDGNTWDNGTVEPILRSQWTGYDAAPAGMVYAVSGGEDGLNPALPNGVLGATTVTTLPRFRMIGGGDPLNSPFIPVNVDDLNDKVRRMG